MSQEARDVRRAIEDLLFETTTIPEMQRQILVDEIVRLVDSAEMKKCSCLYVIDAERWYECVRTDLHSQDARGAGIGHRWRRIPSEVGLARVKGSPGEPPANPA